jgi:hypothetical protein
MVKNNFVKNEKKLYSDSGLCGSPGSSDVENENEQDIGQDATGANDNATGGPPSDEDENI